MDGISTQPPSEIREICQAFREGLIAALGEKLFGIYIYGAAAFPDTFAMGDIDFHVILKEALTEAEKGEIDQLHQVLRQDYPPLGGELDGYYILLDAARGKTPPRSQMWSEATDYSWALHCEHIRAGRSITLYGPDPRQVYPAVSWEEIERALWGELEFVERHLSKYPDYCILNLCRLMYSFATRDVVISKAVAAHWAEQALPEWKPLIGLAERSYSRQSAPEDRERMLAAMNGFYRFACDRIARSQHGQD